MPSLAEQQRIAFEVLYYRHLIRQEAARLDRLPPGNEKQMDAASLSRLIALCFQAVTQLAARLPGAKA